MIAIIPRRAGEHIAQDVTITLIAPPFDVGVWTMSLIWADRNSQDPGLLWLRKRIIEAVAKQGVIEKGPMTRQDARK